MESREDEKQPYLSSLDPILAVKNVVETVNYWHDVLGFPNKWTWGQPPNHGGVRWHNVSVQFTENPDLAAVSEGHCVAINVKNVDGLYAFHEKKNVNIVSPLKDEPWGMTEYMVRDLNGYYLRFGALTSGRVPGAKQLPDNIRIVASSPTAKEIQALCISVGWFSDSGDELPESPTSSYVFAVSARNILTGEVVGCAYLFGDNLAFYYIKDVLVHSDYQGKGIGTAMMREINKWLENNAPDKAIVGLFTGEHLAPFYKQFGLMQACGMYRQINRSDAK